MVKIVIKCEKIKQFYCEVNKSKAHLNIVQLQFFCELCELYLPKCGFKNVTHRS